MWDRRAYQPWIHNTLATAGGTYPNLVDVATGNTAMQEAARNYIHGLAGGGSGGGGGGAKIGTGNYAGRDMHVNITCNSVDVGR